MMMKYTSFLLCLFLCACQKAEHLEVSKLSASEYADVALGRAIPSNRLDATNRFRTFSLFASENGVDLYHGTYAGRDGINHPLNGSTVEHYNTLKTRLDDRFLIPVKVDELGQVDCNLAPAIYSVWALLPENKLFLDSFQAALFTPAVKTQGHYINRIPISYNENYYTTRFQNEKEPRYHIFRFDTFYPLKNPFRVKIGREDGQAVRVSSVEVENVNFTSLYYNPITEFLSFEGNSIPLELSGTTDGNGMWTSSEEKLFCNDYNGTDFPLLLFKVKLQDGTSYVYPLSQNVEFLKNYTFSFTLRKNEITLRVNTTDWSDAQTPVITPSVINPKNQNLTIKDFE